MNDLAQRVKTLRKRMGLNQTDFGARIRYSRGSISAIERGDNENPDVEFLERIAFLEKTHLHNNVQTDRIAEDEERWGPHHSMAPPHALPPEPASRITPEEPTLPHSEYAQAVNWLTLLFDKHPAAFRTAAAMIKGVVDLVTKK
jgi:transcriptional regulator with XRE-family HTH domain